MSLQNRKPNKTDSILYILLLLQEVEDHVGGKADLRALTEARQERGWEVARPEKRVVHESTNKWGTVDTEDVHETSRIQVSPFHSSINILPLN